MKKKPSIFNFFLYFFLTVFLCAIIFIYHFEKRIGPSLIKCAEENVEYLMTLVMNNSIKKYHNQIKDVNYLTINKDRSGEIQLISYNTKAINQAKIQITDILEKDLQNLAKGNFQEIDLKLDTITKDYYEKIKDGVIFTVSAGAATGNSLLTNLGPKIPIKLILVGEINTIINSKVTEYGLNNAMIELFIKTEATAIIQMPFISKKIMVTNEFPLTMEIIQGVLPQYYIGNAE